MRTKHLFQIALSIAICLGMTGCLKLPQTDSGSIGTINWTYNFENEVLTLFGTGEITQAGRSDEGTGSGYNPEDYKRGYYKYSHFPKTVIIEEGFTSIGLQAFINFDRMTTLSIPNSITRIGVEAFRYCDGLSSVTIPDGVMRIEEYAFDGCTMLMSLKIGDGVTSIGQNAFSECTYLSSVTLGKNIQKIGDYAFTRCYRLISVTCYAVTPPKYDTFSPFDNPEEMDLFVPAGSINAYKNNANWRKFRSISAIQ